jgi:hypothetical protein
MVRPVNSMTWAIATLQLLVEQVPWSESEAMLLQLVVQLSSTACLGCTKEREILFFVCDCDSTGFEFRTSRLVGKHSTT